MTRKEAAGVIKFEKACVLRQDTPRCNRDCKKCDLLLPTEDVLTAYDMAIKALEQQPCEDTISRQAAIDAMSESLKRVFPEHRQIAEKCLNVLPSAQEKPFNLPEIYIADGYDTIEGEDGNVGFGVYVPDENQIYVAGDVDGEIRARALLHEICHWVQAMCGRPFDEDEANEFSDIVYDALPSAQETHEERTETHACDLIDRQAAIEVANAVWAVTGDKNVAKIWDQLKDLPAAQPDITDEQAIKHLQSTGWMRNHDREMYESGLREQLADDSGGYDSLISSEDIISRQAAIDMLEMYPFVEYEEYAEAREVINHLPSAQPEPHWIPCSERLPEVGKDVMVCYDFKGHRSVLIGVLYDDEKFHGYDDEYLTPEGRKYRKAVAWMPLPKPYREERTEE